MKSRLLITLAASNAVAIIVIACLLMKPDSAPVPASIAKPGLTAEAISTAPLESTPSHFQSQIASLRAKDYPEEKVHKIVSRDIIAYYQTREAEVATNVRMGRITANAGEVAVAGLEKDKDLDNSSLDNGSQAATANPMDSDAPAGTQTVATAPVVAMQQAETIRMPAVMTSPDPNWQMTDPQALAWQQNQSQFTSSMQGDNSPSSSPEYHRHWQNALTLSDQIFEQQFGSDALNAQGLRAAAAQNAQQ